MPAADCIVFVRALQYFIYIVSMLSSLFVINYKIYERMVTVYLLRLF